MFTFEDLKKQQGSAPASASSSVAPATGQPSGDGGMFSFDQLKSQDAGPAPAPVRSTSGIGKAGDFLAPTTTKTLRNLRDGEDVSLRDVAGTGLEVASYLVPAGAILRGGKALFRGAKTVAGAKKATELEKTQRSIKQITQGTKTLAKEGATVGAVTGGAGGAGRALGDEDASMLQVAGEGAIGTVLGGGLGAVAGPVLGGASNIIKKGVQAPSRMFKKAQQTLNPTDRAQTVEDVTEALSNSFLQDKPGALNKLERILNTSARREAAGFNEQSLLRELAEEGFLPRIDGSLARFRDEAVDATRRISDLSEGVDALAAKAKGEVPLQKFLRETFEDLSDRGDIDITKVEKQLIRLGEQFQRKYGDNLDSRAISEIRRNMNKATKSYSKEGFVLDTSEGVARTTRKYMDEFVPEARELNDQITRLFRMKETMRALNNTPIDVGFLSQAMGRFFGVTAGGAAGLSVAGPGGLVVAGIMANMGSKGLANLIRQARFNPNTRAILKSGMRQDADLLNRILKQATPTDKAVIERMLKETPRLPAPKEGTPLFAPKTDGVARPQSAINSGKPLFTSPGGRASNVKQEAFDAAALEAGKTAATLPGRGLNKQTKMNEMMSGNQPFTDPASLQSIQMGTRPKIGDMHQGKPVIELGSSNPNVSSPPKPEPYIPDDQLPVIDYGSGRRPPNTQAGMSKTGAVATAGGVTALGVGGMKLNDLYQQNAGPQTFTSTNQNQRAEASTQQPELRDAFVHVENRGALASGENLYEVKGVTGDLGKYQVKPETLKDWSKPWLGKQYTPAQFLKDPEAQEEFMNQFLAVVESYGLSPEDAAVVWHKGWGVLGDQKPRAEKERMLREYIEKEKRNESTMKYIQTFLEGMSN